MRSTDHPEAWRVIKIPYDAGQVSLKMEEFLDLPLDKLDKKNEFPSVIHNKTDKKKRGKKKKTCVDDDEDGLNKKKRDYCKIFMDACAPKGLIMLYMSEEKRNRDCADQCIRSFIEYVKDLRGSWRERDYCVTPVLEFCKLLKMMVREDDSLYKHCRSALGSILKRLKRDCVVV
ncbi:E3 ubiquitin-protein ligase UPL5 [Bienertia sinuspersici]